MAHCKPPGALPRSRGGVVERPSKGVWTAQRVCGDAEGTGGSEGPSYNRDMLPGLALPRRKGAVQPRGTV
jgi:hypothetical protein